MARLTFHCPPPPLVRTLIARSRLLPQDNWRNSMMNLQLVDGAAWATVPEGGVTPIKIMSIDTGAGVVSFPGGVEIAAVQEDSLTAQCDDSCTFADDGQCDEPGVVSCNATAAGASLGIDLGLLVWWGDYRKQL